MYVTTVLHSGHVRLSKCVHTKEHDGLHAPVHAWNKLRVDCTCGNMALLQDRQTKQQKHSPTNTSEDKSWHSDTEWHKIVPYQAWTIQAGSQNIFHFY